ncbi:protein phosphatase 1 regulatory subunit 3A, partial [Thalassophryne amazonica]|uniref:protein phosphatase 1 regulatory subunit 3A n=1 Tax=Thalassophryne amazonica TaxID=390379 RepID=UPI001471B2FD
PYHNRRVFSPRSKVTKSSDEPEYRSAVDDEDDDDEDDEDDTENIHLIPRCSPVPRKRGHSLYEEREEYIRTHFALSSEKRVSFADTTGGDLIDVKEFVAFDSDDEEDSARWEEQEAKYRKAEREPVYNVRPEFVPPAGGALIEAVRTNKVEVEHVSPVENEPLSFTGQIRVLNISFHKAVFVRATMDNWVSYFDHPSDYVQGSHDGETDQFSFKLSFAPPYVTHGSRIEFVVRYETSEGNYWANNSHLNYVVTLLLSYEDDAVERNISMHGIRSILRPPQEFSVDDELASEDEHNEHKEEVGSSTSENVQPPAFILPELDIEIHPSTSSILPSQEHPFVDGALSANAVSPGQHFTAMSSETTLQSSLNFCSMRQQSVQPNETQPYSKSLVN